MFRKKMWKRLFASGTAAALLAVTLVGCGSGNNGAANADPAKEEPVSEETKAADGTEAEGAAGDETAATTSEDEITLRFSWWGGDDRHEATLEAIDLYMEMNPHVTIEAEFSGYDGYEEKLATQIAGGTTPDIVQITSARMKEFNSKNKVFIDLNDYSDDLDLSGFEESFLEAYCTQDGELIGLPTGLNAVSFVVNGYLYDEAGLDIPADWDWDTLLEEGKKVNQANEGQYFLATDRNMWKQMLMSYIKQKSGEWLIADDYTIAVSRDLLVEAFSYMLECFEEGVAEPADIAMQYTIHEDPLYLEGNLGAVYSDSSSFGQYKTEKVDFRIYQVPVHKDAAASGVVVQPSQCFTVTDQGNVEQAVDFLNFLYNDEGAVEALRDSRGTPSTSHGRDLLEAKGLLDEDVNNAVNINLQNDIEPINELSDNKEVLQIFTDVLEKLCFQAVSAEDAADECIGGWEVLLEEIKAAE